MLQAVVLDVDGTINTSEQYYAALSELGLSYVAERLKISMEEAVRAVSETRKVVGGMVRAIECLGIPRNELHDEMARRLDFARLIPKEPKLLILIKHLKSLGFKVGLLSDSGRSLVSKILDALGCPADAFDIIVTSDETELKPSKEPYLHIARRLAVDPKEILYVGDRITMELKTARKLGMKTVWVNTFGARYRSPYVSRAIRSIYDLPTVLDALHHDT